MFDHQILLSKSDTSQTSDQVSKQLLLPSTYYAYSFI